MVIESCNICHDSGWVYGLTQFGKTDYDSVVPCKCQTERLNEERRRNYLKYCQLPSGDQKTFANFKTDGRKDLEKALKFAKSLAKETDDIKWLTLIGQTGRGKTHLVVAICNHWLEKDKPARYCFVPLLLKELRDGFDLAGEDSYRIRFDNLCNVQLLVLDDLGVENGTEWGQEQLQTIIHYRGFHGLPLVVTTNQPLDSLNGDTEHRIASRLKREPWCRVVVIDAPEYKQGV